MGILPNDRFSADSDHVEGDGFCYDTCADSIISAEDIKEILCMSTSQLTLSHAIQKQASTANLPFMYFPYMQFIPKYGPLSCTIM